MDCYYHEGRKSSEKCSICDKNVCEECGINIGGNVYCKDCVEALINNNLQNQKENTQKPQEVREKPLEEDSPYNIVDKESEYYAPQEEPVIINDSYDIDYSKYANVSDSKINPEKEEIYTQKQENYIEKPQNYLEKEEYYEDDYIYPDHNYHPEQTSASRALEEKYEKYLDDLYFDEEPLSAQLEKDERKYGPIAKKHSAPPRKEYFYEEEDYPNRSKKVTKNKKIHKMNYKQEKEPIGAIDIILTIILIIIVLIVLYYIVYLIFLANSYPTFTDALIGLKDPGRIIESLTNNP